MALGAAFNTVTLGFGKFIAKAWAASKAAKMFGTAAGGAAAPVAALGTASLELVPLIGSIGLAFGAVAAAAAAVGYAISKVSGIFSSMTETLKEVIPASAGLSRMFGIMGDATIYTTAVAGLKTVKTELAAIQALSPNGQLELTKAMDSVSRAANPRLDHTGLEAAIRAISSGGGGGGSGGGGSSQHTVHIQFNNKMFHDEVIKIVGREISRRNRQ
jgi:hypothetical protein